MSTKISKRQFSELIQTLIRKEIEEVSTTASAGIDGTGTGHYDTPRAFSGKGKDRRSSVASGSGYEKVNEGVTEKLHTYVVESGWWADASDKTKANYIKQHGSPPKAATDDTAGKTDADSWEDDEEARAQAMKDMEDEFDFYFDESVNEDAKDVAKARKLSQKIGNIEGKYRKAMYDLSDRLQADPKNHKLQDELIKSYTKHVTSFMKDMVKITKRVK